MVQWVSVLQAIVPGRVLAIFPKSVAMVAEAAFMSYCRDNFFCYRKNCFIEKEKYFLDFNLK
jgi:hypothetical protein